MKKKTLTLSILSLALFVSLAITGVASAHGWFSGNGLGSADPDTVIERQTSMFEHQAEILGISLDQVKEYWSQGKNMQEIADDLGLDMDQIREKMHNNQKIAIQQNLQTMVNAGLITQSQADARIQFMESTPNGNRFGGPHEMGKRGMKNFGPGCQNTGDKS